jgi:mono/diheme cytochrome c family protein
MLRRSRTTKKLAKRIDLQYFTRPHAFRRWRFWLSVAVPVLALGWLVTQRAQGGQKVYSSGPLAASHAVFTQQCSLCHVARTASFSAQVNDQACLACHDAPAHHTNQTFTPACSSCHLEHKGARSLSATSDSSCSQCHADLRTRDGQPHYVASITKFTNGHPEFSALRTGKADPGKVKFNHNVHLQPHLMGPSNARVELSCDDCHRTTKGLDGWPYAATFDASQVSDSVPLGLKPPSIVGRGGTAEAVSFPSASFPSSPVVRMSADPRAARQRYMAPVTFSQNCAACHTLQFDKRFGNEQTPHDKPEVVHSFLLGKFGGYIAAHPEALHEVNPPDRQIPERVRVPRVARNASEWVQFRTDDAEWLLWSKTCKQCHTLNPGPGPLPEVAKPNLAAPWLSHARFDHTSHQMMSCTSCHANTRKSRETSDVLLPGIQTCQQCHREDKPKESAEGRCFECHQYHDWTKAKRTNRKFTIPELRGMARLTPQ